jgi:hypothetical protein
MRPPAQVVTLVFFCVAADLSMVQAKRDPPLALTFACGRNIGGRIDDCPAVQRLHSTTLLVTGSMAARTAYANFTVALRCATRCRQNAYMSTITAASAISEHLRTPPAQSRPLCPFLNLTHTHTPPSPRMAPTRPRLPPPRRPVPNDPSLRSARTRSNISTLT